jgi:hypothetical protein
MTITIPRHGAWVADVVLAAGTLAPEAAFGASIVFGDLSLVGTVFRQGEFGGSVRARVVAGGGGWRKSIRATGYDNPVGILKSAVLGDAARDCGERISIEQDSTIGTNWARREGIAERTLRYLSGGEWWIDASGTTQVRARKSGRISSQYTATQRLAGSGRFEIATEVFSDWIPGRTFSSAVVPVEQTINAVVLRSTDGSARVSVLTGPADEERLLQDVRSIIDSQVGTLAYAGAWTYTIAAGTPESASIVPKSGSPMPQLTSCKYMPGLVGEKVTPAPGSTCYVTFLDQDPGQPRIFAIEGAPLVYEQTAAISKIGAGLRPAAAMGDLAGPFPIVATALRTLI